MKRFSPWAVAGALAVATLGTTLGAGSAAAQNYGPPPPYHAPYHPPYYHPPYYHPPYARPGVWGGWHRGDRFYGDRFVVRDYDWGRYHLRPAPRGYEWVQDRGQFVLIGIDTGIVSDIYIR